MNLTITMTGTTPLLCHNAQLADPDHEISREIKLITSKKKKTEDDRRAIERLEWMGGLYLSSTDGTPAMPTANVRKCFIEAGKTRKLGKQIGRAVTFIEMETPLIYDGPRDVQKLLTRPEFRHRATVRKIDQRRVSLTHVDECQTELVARLFHEPEPGLAERENDACHGESDGSRTNGGRQQEPY